jgi:hypothetical protein
MPHPPQKWFRYRGTTCRDYLHDLELASRAIKLKVGAVGPNWALSESDS